MMAQISATDEACQALVDRINSGTDYVLDLTAEYTRVINESHEDVDSLRVDVVPNNESPASVRLDGADNTEMEILIWIRSPLPADQANLTVSDLMSLRAAIRSRVDNWNSSDRRVQVWDVDVEPIEAPEKEILRRSNLFVTSILLRVQVEP